MSSPERVTPSALVDLFRLMSDEEQCDFLGLLGNDLTAEAPFLLATSFDPPELMRFAGMVLSMPIISQTFRVMEHEAIRFARSNLDLSEEEMKKQFNGHMKQFFETYNREIGEAEAAKLKQDRDRSSDPETVQRNVRICDLRTINKKLWSLRRLAKEFGVTPQYIGKVLKSEAEWRRLAVSANQQVG